MVETLRNILQFATEEEPGFQKLRSRLATRKGTVAQRVVALQQPPGRKPMGFFDFAKKIVGGAIKIGAGLLGFGAPAVRAAAPAARRIAPAVAAGAAGVAAGVATGIALTPEAAAAAGVGGAVINPATGQVVGVGGGNGLFATVTQVTTINRVTGQIARQETFKGRPWIMAAEVAHMKATAKKLIRGAGKVHRKVAKQSMNSMIADALKDRMLHSAQQGAAAAACP